MRNIAAKLTAQEMTAVAEYLAPWQSTWPACLDVTSRAARCGCHALVAGSLCRGTRPQDGGRPDRRQPCRKQRSATEDHERASDSLIGSDS